MKKIRERTIQAATAVAVSHAAVTAAFTAGYYRDFQTIYTFFDDGAAAARNYTIYAQYSPDASTWFEDYPSQIAGTNQVDYYLEMIGGFYCRASALKAVATENITISAFGDFNPNITKLTVLQAATTTSCKTTETALYTGGAADRDCDYVIVYVDDNGNANALTLQAYLSDDAGTTWFKAGATIAGNSAIDRRCAVVVHNHGHSVKVTGVKGVGAEDVIVYAEGRVVKVRRRG
jgi:hypothetical protein